MLIVANGMPRSGSTLQFNVIRMLLAVHDTGVPELPPKQRPADAQPWPDALVDWARDDTYHLVKDHAVHPSTPDLLAEGNLSVCYIFRDLRDVCVSRRISWAEKNEQFWEGMDRAVAAYWQLRELREVYPDRFLWQAYSDVAPDLPSAVREAAAFLGPDASEAVVDQIATVLSLESAKVRQEGGKAYIQRTLQALRQRDPHLAARYIQALRRGRNESMLVVRDFDRRMDYNHISPYGGAIGIWRTRLDEPTRVEIERRYEDWFEDAFGPDWADKEQQAPSSTSLACPQDKSGGTE